jgi:ribosomal protein S6
VLAYQSLTNCKLLIIASGEENTFRRYSMRELAFIIDNMQSGHFMYKYNINLSKNSKYSSKIMYIYYLEELIEMRSLPIYISSS